MVNFIDNETPLSAENLNKLQSDLQEYTNDLIDERITYSTTEKVVGTVLFSSNEGTKNDTINFTGGIISEGELIEITFGRFRVSTGTMVIKTTGKVRYFPGIFISLDMLYNSGEAMETNAKRVIINSTGLTTDYKNNDNLAIKEIRKFSY